ncbi:glycosyltransferase [Paenibacillus harenae]|uniref:glycosyltransferase n=1 Tax=Paenibacillus harenae TaxID=306543 RepID=UPI00278CABF2|nr:glycosyltransferase [Paenibacillus harenae]MDQ0060617.1 glycosyltransferase involved in cell wall biosynthesis [Paenibacillus harenae]
MKIAVVVFLFGGASGGIKAANTIASQLSDCGHDVTLLTCEEVKGTFFEVHRDVPLHTIGKVFSKAEYEKYPEAAVDSNPYMFQMLEDRFQPIKQQHLFMEDLLYRDLRLLRPDCVVSVLFQTHAFAVPAAARAGIPIIASEHNSPKSYQELWWMSRDELDYLYEMLGFTDKIHILSPSYSSGYPAKLHHKMVPIGNGIDPAAPQKGPRKNRIIAVGELSEWKNYGVLIDAFMLISETFPDWKLQLYGEGPEKEALMKKVSKNAHVVKRVLFMSIAPQREVLESLRSAKIFCHPSLAESFGLAVAEGLAAGLPAIGLEETDGVNQLIHDGINGYLVPTDGAATGIAEALSKMMKDSEHLESMGREAAASVKHLSSGAIAEQWDQLVNRVCAAAPTRKRDIVMNDVHYLPLVTVVSIVRADLSAVIASLQSVWNQTYDRIEHVAIDCSMDNKETMEFIKSNLHLMDERIMSASSGKDAIISAIQRTKGEIVVVLDGSERLDRFAVERAVLALSSPQADVVVGTALVATEAQPGYEGQVADLSLIWTGKNLVGGSVFARRAAFESQQIKTCEGSDRLKWFLSLYDRSNEIIYENSLFVHAERNHNAGLDETKFDIIQSYAYMKFDKVKKDDIDFLLKYFQYDDEAKGTNGEGRVHQLIGEHIHRQDFVHSIVKAMYLHRSENILIQKHTEMSLISRIEATFPKRRMYRVKEVMKYKLQGTVWFKPVKSVYAMAKKIKRTLIKQ